MTIVFLLPSSEIKVVNWQPWGSQVKKDKQMAEGR
jgi:hypothetical protein